jgi:hypothetical protein
MQGERGEREDTDKIVTTLDVCALVLDDII